MQLHPLYQILASGHFPSLFNDFSISSASFKFCDLRKSRELHLVRLSHLEAGPSFSSYMVRDASLMF